MDLDVRGLALEPDEGWWIRIRLLGSDSAFLAPPMRISEPIDIAIPAQIVETSGLMNFIVSYTASPE